MTIKLHNSMTRAKEDFTPIDPDHVRMYVCGPTVYDFAHIGNARPVVVFDVLYRLLRLEYPKVTYVRNITDIEDKIMDAAKVNGESIEALTQRTADQFHEDVEALGTMIPDQEPRATAFVGEMLALIDRLVADGHAYEADGHVLFNVPSMPNYGRLSKLDRDAQIAGARVEVAPYKRDPADFVLWKPSRDDQPGWDSNYGRGRPGWHIECSAMSEAILGLPFDIHGGGQDLIFPHHENEIAQSCCAHKVETMANYWLHNGYLMVDGEKMSKSLGNFYTVRELLDDFRGEEIRFTLLSTHYRSPLDFTKDGLKQSRSALDRLYGALRSTQDLSIDRIPEPPADLVAALRDDLNTPLAISKLHGLAAIINKSDDPAERAKAKGELLAAGDLLGLLQQDAEAWYKWQPSARASLDEQVINDLIEERQTAKQDRDFARADEIRDQLKDQGVLLEDGPTGTTWRRTG
ncbi:MAG: cysteine--tRNA ligase [Alphaproteobacteria bacterium]|nr:cysteine--tRNA ligase [Alphaproteobacteria bacterium]MAS45862.1 cysteine--tRNA ligase [Alphaproteobacteria bacterium]MAX95956.1 cysteine--tRNA ligase [Alphaproteobacteria bacterium]MBN52973.1 cysteine--tRNA ligase [Alphaproteobacteria bacterium]OUT42482.1 MAG: cysteine--tRNA ligase [Micavibrio sp. TMED2]|tara:strand:+ start:3605 stop:4990 length:1386 start_codon:yes stop_codon:yes gene_type:complete